MLSNDSKTESVAERMDFTKSCFFSRAKTRRREEVLLLNRSYAISIFCASVLPRDNRF